MELRPNACDTGRSRRENMKLKAGLTDQTVMEWKSIILHRNKIDNIMMSGNSKLTWMIRAYSDSHFRRSGNRSIRSIIEGMSTCEQSSKQRTSFGIHRLDGTGESRSPRQTSDVPDCSKESRNNVHFPKLSTLNITACVFLGTEWFWNSWKNLRWKIERLFAYWTYKIVQKQYDSISQWIAAG